MDHYKNKILNNSSYFKNITRLFFFVKERNTWNSFGFPVFFHFFKSQDLMRNLTVNYLI